MTFKEEQGRLWREALKLASWVLEVQERTFLSKCLSGRSLDMFVAPAKIESREQRCLRGNLEAYFTGFSSRQFSAKVRSNPLLLFLFSLIISLRI
jgi:hypothetical protein